MKKLIIFISLIAVFAFANEQSSYKCRTQFVHIMIGRVHQITYICVPHSNSTETNDKSKKNLSAKQQTQMYKYLECLTNSSVEDCIRNTSGLSGKWKEKCIQQMEAKCGTYPEFK